MRESIAENLVRLVKARALYCCEYCLVHEDNFYLSGEVDHIKPIKHGGTNELLLRS
jgi:5-methylcytosine-specific restriction endonuclease McrA